MTWPVAVALASALLNGAIGALSTLQGRGRPLYRSFSLLSFSFGFWSLLYALAWPGFDDAVLLKVLFTPLSWLPGAALSFAWTYTGLPETERRNRTVPVYGAGLLALGLLWSERLSINQFRLAFLALGGTVFAVATGLLLLHWRRAEEPEEANRRGYLAAAAVIASVGGMTDFMPGLGAPVPPLANLSLMAYTLIVLAAISRHHLMDLRAAAGRVLALGSVALALGLALTGLEWATRKLEGPLFVNFFIASLAFLILLPPAWHRVVRTFERALFKRPRELEAALERLRRAIEAPASGGTAPLERVSQAARDAVRHAWGAECEVLWTRGLRGIEPVPALPETLRAPLSAASDVWTPASLARDGAAPATLLPALRSRRASAVAPVLREGELVGAVLLGPPSAGFYDLAAVRWLRSLSLELGRAVRAAELTQEALHADRLAQLGQTTAAVAHEIRNPLSIILVAVEMLRRSPESERPQYFEAIETEVRRLSAILQDMLDFASFKPHKERCSWAEVWGRLEKLVRAGAAAELDLRTRAEDLQLAVSGPHLKQILLNLVQNAARAACSAGAGGRAPAAGRGPRVLVTAAARDGKAVIEVADNGPGVPPELMARLFTPFATGSPGGTGLGLAAVRRIAELYGGRAWAENLEPGARFTVELPLASPPGAK